MPINAGHEYQRAEIEYQQADTLEEKLATSKKMLSVAPKHKGSENLLALIKKRIAKLIKQIDRQKEISRKSGRSIGLKKEGAARVCIIGVPNSGKSTLLSKITNAKPEISDFPFTTKKTEVGILDHRGVKIQIVEIPPIVKDFLKTENGGYLASVIRESTLLILVYRKEEDRRIIKREMRKMGLKIPFVMYNFEFDTPEQIKHGLWKNLGLIRIFTKQPRKPKDFPPVALKKGSTIQDLAGKVHKDFLKNFKFARVFGKSVKFRGQQVGLNHVLIDEDVVEIHAKD